MSVYIKGMEMPNIPENNGINCCLFKSFGGAMRLRNNETGQVFDLLPVQEPHGRLGDLDALLAKENAEYADLVNLGEASENTDMAHEDIQMILSCAPAIIPAEPPNEEAKTQSEYLQNWHEEESE